MSHGLETEPQEISFGRAGVGLGQDFGSGGKLHVSYPLPHHKVEADMNMRSLIPWGRDSALPTTRSGDEASPFLSLHRQMNRLFDEFFRDFETPFVRNGWSTGWPNVEVSEDDKTVKVVAELPGLDEKDIDITMRDGVLTLKGEKKHESNGSVYSERWHGQFTRSLQLGDQVDPDKVKASFNKGVLAVTLEKRPEVQSRTKRIAINRSE